MDINRRSGQSVMIGRLEDLAVRVRQVGLVAEIVYGPSYPVLVARSLSPVVARVMAGRVHFWWYGYGTDVYPIASVDDPVSVMHDIHRRVRAMGGRA
jgi:hypothetical protein